MLYCSRGCIITMLQGGDTKNRLAMQVINTWELVKSCNMTHALLYIPCNIKYFVYLYFLRKNTATVDRTISRSEAYSLYQWPNTSLVFERFFTKYYTINTAYIYHIMRILIISLFLSFSHTCMCSEHAVLYNTHIKFSLSLSRPQYLSLRMCIGNSMRAIHSVYII